MRFFIGDSAFGIIRGERYACPARKSIPENDASPQNENVPFVREVIYRRPAGFGCADSGKMLSRKVDSSLRLESKAP